MSLFAITFRVDYDSEAEYNRRYQSLVQAIKDAASTGKYWDDPTSFFLINSDFQSAALADHLVAQSSFDNSKDHLLVINLSLTKGHAHRGKLIDQDLVPLMASRT